MLKKIASLITVFLIISVIVISSLSNFNSIAEARNIPTDNQSLIKIENLITRGKIIAPNDGEYGLVNSIKANKLSRTVIDLIILLANQFDSIDIASIYRPYVGGWPAHSNGEAIDLSSVTYQGVQYTHQQAIYKDNQIASGVWVYIANILRESKSVITVITALDLAEQYAKVSGFIKQDITGSIEGISVMTSPGGSDVTSRHEDHMHIEVTPDRIVQAGSPVTPPKVNGQGTSPNTSQGPIEINPSLYTSNADCKNTLGLNYSFGMTGGNIKQLQNCLTKLGLFSFPGGSTGYYGNVTTASYNQWLARTGICPFIKGVKWVVGERSSRVEAMQKCLQKAGLFDYPSITGFFGPITNSGYNRWLKL